VFIQAAPGNLLDKFSVLPLQIYNWAQQPANQGFHGLAAGGIIVLLAMLLVFNGLAVFIRHRLQKPLS
jgi:phosphate transport system permease protein